MKPLTKMVVVLVVLIAAAWAVTVYLDNPAPPRDDEQMERFLCGSGNLHWLPEDAAGMRFHFKDDGTFSAERDGTIAGAQGGLSTHMLFPEGVLRIEGKWRAKTSVLLLSDMTTADGQAVQNVIMNLAWVDNGNRVRIANTLYAKASGAKGSQRPVE